MTSEPVDNRPGSAPEIRKFATVRCVRCGIEAVSAVVEPDPQVKHKGFCRNKVACTKRARRAGRPTT